MVKGVEKRWWKHGAKAFGTKVYLRSAGAGLLVLFLALVGGTLWGLNPPNSRAEATGKVIRVPAGGDLQGAIARATGGDIIELQTGATYGPITLPAKQISEFITITSAAAPLMATDERVAPADRIHMARIVTRSEGVPAVTAAKGAHHYRFVGIEFTAETDGYIYNLVQFGDEKSRADVPHHLEIDRSYLHPGSRGIVRRGLALNSSETIVKNSNIEGFGFPDQETQGICGWAGTDNVKILNNYIEGGAENIMFGGSDPASSDMIPTNIEVRRNHLRKPAIWRGKASMKTLFELKNARNVEFAENLLENSWIGSAMRITVRNQDGKAPFSTLENINIRDNLIIGAGDGINILGKDDANPSATMRGLTISNNVFLVIDPQKHEGSGYFVQISGGENILIEHNTVFNSGNTVTFYGDLPRNLVIRNNIIGHGEYGVHGLSDLKKEGAKIFSLNAIFNSRRVAEGDLGLAPGSILVQSLDEFGFIDAASGDFRLMKSSRFKGKATDGTDIGASLDTKRIRTMATGR